MTDSILTLTGVRKAFGGVQALSDGALNLWAGQVTALIGENGAGKSTLVKIMTGVLAPDAGEILFEGQPVHLGSPAAAQRLGIAAIHQESVIFDNLSVAENIFIMDPPRRGPWLDWTAMARRAGELLQALDCDIDPARPTGRLSVAQKHLVQIARALAQDARVVILDEPTAALSHQEACDLFAVVRNLRDQGRAILFISHKFEEVFELCDRYAVFRDGAAVGQGALADTTRAGLIEMMVGRAVDHVYPERSGRFGAEALRIEGFSRGLEFADVNLSVRSGEIVGVYGLVGSGRSEVMQAIFGLTRPTAGRLWLDGEEVQLRNPGQAIAHGIAYVPEDRQHQGAILDQSIADNIALPNLGRWSRFGLADVALRDREAEALTAQLKVKSAGIISPVRDLSGGNQQKVVLAKWLATQPKVLILDEPTKGVDIGSKLAVHQAVNDLAAEGLAIVLVSSDLPEVLGMADRVLVMRRGRVRAEVSRADATPEMIMRAATDA